VRLRLIDSHCHLDDDRFDPDRDQIVTRAKACNIERIVIPATTAQRWQKVKQVSEDYEGVYPTYGLHPMFMDSHQAQHISELDAWLDRENPIAVGECGLDFFIGREDEVQQIKIFNDQLQLAKNHRLPVIIHVRKAMDQTISLLRKSAPLTGVIHSFAGSQQQADQLIDLGFKLGIGATVGFERAKKLRSVVATVPDTGLLIESDAPDQPGANHRGERNEPAFIIEQLAMVALLRNVSENELAQTLLRNTNDLFGFKDEP
jgi:TatD DNase family protein